MDTDDDLFLNTIEFGTLDVLAYIGDDPDARYAFFKRFVALAQEIAGGRDRVSGLGPGH